MDTDAKLTSAVKLRTVLHVDLDAFFCSVEELNDSSLIGTAFAVGGSPSGRGVVASCSYVARRYGVRSAMPMSRALAMCPGLRVVKSSYDVYSKKSREVMRLLNGASGIVQQISIDEAFLEIYETESGSEPFARELQSSILTSTRLPCSIGIASNKLVAKIATDVGKSRSHKSGTPQALLRVPHGDEAKFLAPLPVNALWGVGPKTEERLAELGIKTISDIVAWPQQELERRFGKNGRELAQHARGIDTRPLSTDHTSKSISKETTFANDVSNETQLLAALRTQSNSIANKLKADAILGGVVRLKIRWGDFTTLTRQSTPSVPTDDPAEIFRLACALMREIRGDSQPVRLIGVGVGNLKSPGQLSLWDDGPAKRAEQEKRAVEALAKVRGKFGQASVVRASDLARSRFDEEGHANFNDSGE